MGKIDFKTSLLCFCIFLFAISYSVSVLASPTTRGIRVIVSAGSDPDIALDAEGHLHLAYVRNGSTYYRKVTMPYTNINNIGKEYYIGGGGNPQIAVDSLNNPHIVYSTARYSFFSKSKFVNIGAAFSGWRKNLIAIDSKDRVYIIADRDTPRSVLLKVYHNGKAIKGPIKIGDDNPGGVGVDSNNTLHFTTRRSNTYYNTYSLEKGLGAAFEFPNLSGDFSWCSVSPKDNTVHLIYTAAQSRGLYYNVKKNGIWTQLGQVASGYGDMRQPDNVNPVTATDSTGNTYITFRGNSARGYYMVYDENHTRIPIIADGDGIAQFATGTHPGAKMTNPNVTTHPKRQGAYVAWGTSLVYINSIGDIPRISDNNKFKLLIGVNHLLLKK